MNLKRRKRTGSGYALLFIGSALAFSGCKKDTPINPSDRSTTISNVKFESIDGMLSFEDEESMYKAQNDLNRMRPEGRLNWSKNNSIITQQVLMDKASLAQEDFEKNEYAGLPEDISVREMRQLGKEPQLCAQYETLIQKNILEKITEDDGSISMRYSQEDPGLALVLDEDGFVIVDNVLFQYTGNTVKFMPYESSADRNTLRNANQSNEALNLIVVSSTNRAPTVLIGDIFNQTSNNWIWYYNSSNERFNHYVYMKSDYVVSSGRTTSTYYTRSTGEKKTFWNLENQK